jgi:tetratricopeptide (TPR) repeat protein/transcriptional regulator with XRE-family HTH domain
MTDEVEVFGARLGDCRRAAGLSQQELADRSGLSVRAVANLERGRVRWPHPDSLERLADALGLRDESRMQFIASAERRLGQARDTGVSNPSGSQTRGGPQILPRCLPTAVPGFVGRRDQLAALSQALVQPGGTPVVAIDGTAGVGKSALAVQWAYQAADEFPDGQLFVNLRGFGPAQTPVPPAEAVRVFLDALQIPAERLPQTEEGQLGLYRSLVAAKRILVVLDNARDVAQVRPLLPGSPTCRIVVTSRRKLTGLAALEAASPLTLDVLSDAEARQLLHNRLGPQRLAAEPGAVTQVIRLCARLPLALCVIAARVAMTPGLSLEQVAEEMAVQENLDALADHGDPAADVRVAFSWSYRQLDSDAARVFRLAGLHPGPGLGQHAVAALAGASVDYVGRILDVLAGTGMIQYAGPSRYGMHDLLRRYARELAEREDSEPERRAALTGLLDHYLYVAATAMDTAFPSESHRRPRIPAPPAAALRITDAAGALAWLDAERASLTAVTVYAAERGWSAHAAQLSATLFRYLDTQGRYTEATTIHTHACRAARQVGDAAAEADACNSLGVMNLRQGRYPHAAPHFERALTLYRQTASQTGQARALANLGFLDFLRGRSQRAAERLGVALQLFREIGDEVGEARALASLGYADLRQGRYQQSADNLRQSLTVCKKVGDRGGQARALGYLGEVESRLGDLTLAATHGQQALALFRELGDRISEADALASLGLIHLRQGRPDQAVGHLNHALSICKETGDLSSFAAALNGLGEALLATGRSDAASGPLATALEAATRAGEKYEQARAHNALARASQANHNPAQADDHRNQALALYTNLGAPEADQIRAQLATARTPKRGTELTSAAPDQETLQ